LSIQRVKFQHVNLDDPFFNSLKADYKEFEAWFAKKSANEAYLSVNSVGAIDGFLYLKTEDEAHPDIEPPLSAQRRLKVGTFKIDAHGTKLGDRFVKKLFDQAMAACVDEIYLTIFEKHEGLIKLLAKFGFAKIGTKTTHNGTELVLARNMTWQGDDLLRNYPLVRVRSGRKFLLALYPQWHTRLLPDSKLINEGPDVVADVSHTNSIEKIYLAGRSEAENLRHGDAIIIYRTSDQQGPAFYRSVATSVCVVDRVRSIAEFSTQGDFLDYCMPYSVFSEDELKSLYKSRKYPVIITFSYNISFPKRVNRKVLIEEIGIDPSARIVCLQVTDAQFLAILKKGSVDENFVVN
jgi:L-amino acid N-acyltransferase YncA